jgi:metal transporter CNNM
LLLLLLWLQLAPVWSPTWDVCLGCAVGCVLVAALAAGLTVGLVSIDPFDLQVILETDVDDCETEEEREQLVRDKQHAAKLLPLVRRHHLLLVTLLLLNSAANETLPLFLDRVVPSWLAVIISVTLVLVFGEIVPSAVFTGSGQLTMAAALQPVVWVCMVVFAPIAWPIAKLLDCSLGHSHEEPDYYRRGELKALVKLQSAQVIARTHSSAASSASGSGNGTPRRSLTSSATASPSSMALSTPAAKAVREAGLTTDEVTIITGALEMKAATVGQVCVPLQRVFMLSVDDRLDLETLASMLAAGHSRIPVYEGDSRHNIRGLLLVKRLIVISPEDRRLIGSLTLRRPLFVPPSLSLFDCLNLFQGGVSHLAVVCSEPERAEAACRAGQPMPEGVSVSGIVTLEDLLERLIKEEIEDETDVHGVMAELEGIRVRRKRVAAFRKAATRMRWTLGVERQSSLTAGDLRLLTAKRDSGRGSRQNSRQDLLPAVSINTELPLPSPTAGTQLLSPSSARGSGSTSEGYGSVEDASSRGGRRAVVTRRWLRAAEKVVARRHARRRAMDDVKEDNSTRAQRDKEKQQQQQQHHSSRWTEADCSPLLSPDQAERERLIDVRD